MTDTPDRPPLEAYEAMRRDHPELFRNDESGDGIDIVDPEDADAPREVGVVYSDPYIRLLRDPVRFPDGRTGTYVRLLGYTLAPAAAVLPLLDDRVVLLENYRHATRSWHWEIPRGFGTEGLTAEENALKELQEEIGAQTLSITPVGAVHPDSGLQAQSVRLFVARLAGVGDTEKGAGIRRVVLLTPQELDSKILDGSVTDGFTLAAMTQARLRNLLDGGQ
ncbi:NUDIX hydrolase [Streptomyces griseoincarnatus]|uniref:NUDIX hydrolase n=1 Tax=Streptomyces sp. SMS_SU21 TaxID=2069440 RepID=UPI000C88DAD8|nr:NUDIX hydrolase [Streptomyces sp. SMS_SU21]MCA2200823.1 NUDIX hydrolase [Streptomyces sp. SMS_SU21]